MMHHDRKRGDREYSWFASALLVILLAFTSRDDTRMQLAARAAMPNDTAGMTITSSP